MILKQLKDIQDALRDLLGGTIKSMMEAEMSEHLGYEKSERFDSEYSRAVTPQIRQAGNRLSGLAETAYASLLA